MSNASTAVFALSVRPFNNDELAALSNALQSTGFVHYRNLAFNKCLEMGLVGKNCDVLDLEALQTACAGEINKRIENGTFN